MHWTRIAVVVATFWTIGQAALGAETVLLDFTADWCGPCQMVKPIVERLAAEGHPVRQVNIDRNRSQAAQYRVTSIPCFVMLVNGREVDRHVGMATRAQLTQMLNKARIAQTAAATGPRTLAQSPDNLPASDAKAMPAVLSSAGRTPTPVRATVRITVEDAQGRSHGTGTMIDARDGEALVLTCGHLFRESKGKGPILIDLLVPGGPKQLRGTLISYDLNRDLGLIAFRPGVEVSVARVAPRDVELNVGERLVNIGCNHGQEATARRSHVTAIDKYMGPSNVEVSGMPVEGRSGGGLFNESGQLVGVCFAADPEANEGVYAGLPSIHDELDRLQLKDIYAPPANENRPATRLVAVTPPAMPKQMPVATGNRQIDTMVTPAALVEPAKASGAADSTVLAGSLSAAEQAALAEIRRRGQDAEVICIIRPLSNPDAKSEIIVLDRASPLFLEQISGRHYIGKERQLTSHEVRTRRR